MTADTTTVIFRTLNPKEVQGGEVIALFPEEPHSFYRPEIVCYMHVGQHFYCLYNDMIACSRPATPDEYADLKAELEDIGYDLDIRLKRSHQMLQNFRDLQRNYQCQTKELQASRN